MATIVNNPDNGRGDNGGTGGWIIAIVLIVILLLLALFVFPDAFSGDTDVDAVPTAETNGVNNGTGTEPPPVINNTTFNSSTTINTGTTTGEE